MARYDRKIKAMFKKVRTIAVKSARTHLRAVAEVVRDDLKKRIENQEFRSFREKPLTEKYRVYKAYHGLDDRVMIATGTYVDSIDVIQVNPDTFKIGFEPDMYAVRADGEVNQDLPLEVLARIQEFGSITANIPARPHWRPTFRRISDRSKRIAQNIGKLLVKDLRKALR